MISMALRFVLDLLQYARRTRKAGDTSRLSEECACHRDGIVEWYTVTRRAGVGISRHLVQANRTIHAQERQWTKRRRGSPARRWLLARGPPLPGRGSERKVAQFARLVMRLDPSHRPAGRPHHHGMRGRATVDVLHAFEQLAVGDPGDGEHHIVALHQVVDREDLVDIDVVTLGDAPLLIVSQPQARLQVTAKALER